MNDNKELVTVEDHLPNVVNPLDLPVEVFGAALDRRGANRKRLMEWVRSSLVEDVDFGRIKIGGRVSKPSLYKPGAEKICGMLGVTVTFPTLAKYEEAAYSGVELKNIVLRCELVDGNGNVVATGTGSRSLAQDNNDINKCIKMAEKSGHIDAVLRLAGLSEVFTQDIEDMKQDDRAMKEGRPNMSAPLDWKGDGTDIWPYGKHKDKPMSEVPDPYLVWCTQNMDMGPAGWAEQELERRKAGETPDYMKKGKMIEKIGHMEGEAFERGLLTSEMIAQHRVDYMGTEEFTEAKNDGIEAYGKALKKLLEDSK